MDVGKLAGSGGGELNGVAVGGSGVTVGVAGIKTWVGTGVGVPPVVQAARTAITSAMTAIRIRMRKAPTTR